MDPLEQLDEAAPGILFLVQVAHVDLPDPVLHQPEVALEPTVEQVGLIRVPADPDPRVAPRVVQDLPDARQPGGLAAMHLELDLQALIGRGDATLVQRLADLLEARDGASVLPQAVWPHL